MGLPRFIIPPRKLFLSSGSGLGLHPNFGMRSRHRHKVRRAAIGASDISGWALALCKLHRAWIEAHPFAAFPRGSLTSPPSPPPPPSPSPPSFLTSRLNEDRGRSDHGPRQHGSRCRRELTRGERPAAGKK